MYYCAFLFCYYVVLFFSFLTEDKLLQITENISQDGLPQQLNQQQVLGFLQGKFTFHINFYILKASFFSWLGLMAHRRCILSLKYIFKGVDLFYCYLIVTEKYEPVHAKWTTERCAVCRWVEDWEDNKIIICNRCFHYCS